MSERRIELMLERLEEANKLAKELIRINDLNYRRFLSMRSRLTVLTILHKDELAGMGFNINRWVKALEIEDKRQLHALTLSLKRK